MKKLKCTNSNCGTVHDNTQFMFCPFCGGKLIPYDDAAQQKSEGDLWYETAFKEYPSVIAHEYKRLQQEYECSSNYTILCQLKDVIETTLKFEVLAFCAWAKHVEIEGFERIACDITTPSLSLGAWLAIADNIISFFKKKTPRPDILFDTLSALCSFYKKHDFVHWRNVSIGHGALALEENAEEAQTSIREKLKELKSLFSDSSIRFAEQILIGIRNDGNAEDLTGHDKALDLDGISELKLRIDNEVFSLSPHIVINGDNGKEEATRRAIFFFDNQKNQRLTQQLCYTTADRNAGYNPYFSGLDEIRRRLSVDGKLSVNADNIIADENEFLNRMSLREGFVEPQYLTEWLRAEVKKNSRGLFLLKMPRGTGKSTFTEKLNRLYPNPQLIDEDIDVRTYHITRSQLRDSSDFRAAIEDLWTSAFDKHLIWPNTSIGDKRINDFLYKGDSPSEAFLRFLEAAQKFTSSRRGCSRILMIVDGLDEIDNETIWQYVPDSEEKIPENVYILLTSRDPDTEDGLSVYFKEKLEQIKPSADLTINGKSEGNLAFLEAYINRQIGKKISEKRKRSMLEQAEYRVLYLGMLCQLYISGVRIEDIGKAKNISKHFLKNLEYKYGEKNTAQLHLFIAILCAISQDDPLSLNEIASLAEYGYVTFDLIGMINDLMPILRIVRGYAIDGIAYVGCNRYQIVNSDLSDVLISLLPNYDKDITTLTMNMILEAKENVNDTRESEASIVLAQLTKLLPLKEFGDTFAAEDILHILQSCKTDDKLWLNRKAKAYEQILTIEEMLQDTCCGLSDVERAQAHCAYAQVLMELQRFEFALIQAEKACAVLEEDKGIADAEKTNSLSTAYNTKGTILTRLRPLESIRYLLRAIDLLKSMGSKKIADRIKLAVMLNNAAYSWHEVGNDDKAIELYKEALELHEELMSTGIMTAADFYASACKNIAVSLYELDKLDEALQYAQEARRIREKLGEDTRNRNNLAKVYNDIALYCKDGKKEKEALAYYQKAIVLQEELNKEGRLTNANDLVGVYQHYADMLIANGNLQEALELCNKAIDLIQTMENGGLFVNKTTEAELYCLRAAAHLDSIAQTYIKQFPTYLQGQLKDSTQIWKVLEDIMKARALCDQLPGTSREVFRVIDEHAALESIALKCCKNYLIWIRACDFTNEVLLQNDNFFRDHVTIGAFLLEKGDLEEGLDVFLWLLKVFENQQNFEKIILIRLQIFEIVLEMQMYEVAMNFSKETCILCCKYTDEGKLDNKVLLSQAYNNLRLMQEFNLRNEE